MAEIDAINAFRVAGEALEDREEFRIQDVLEAVRAQKVQNKDIASVLGIHPTHVGRVLREKGSFALREHTILRLHELTGLSFKQLIYANSLNSLSDEFAQMITVDESRRTVGAKAAGPPKLQDKPKTWHQRNVVAYLKLTIGDFNKTSLASKQDLILRHAAWEDVADHLPLPTYRNRDNVVYVRAASPMMEPDTGQVWPGSRCVIPRGSIVEVDLTKEPTDGSIVLVQFELEPAEFYEYRSYNGAAGAAEAYYPRQSHFPNRIVQLPYDPEAPSIHRMIIGVAVRIVEKFL